MNKNLKTPKEIIAEILEIDIDLVNNDSAYGKTPNWDSLNHIAIINELESIYEIKIKDHEIENYLSIEAINKLLKDVVSKKPN